MNEDLVQKFGYSEMYEWYTIPDNANKLARFVTFSEDNPSKIELYSKLNQPILGITTVNSVIDSDNPTEWKYKNLCNEYGDMYLRNEKLAVGQKVYDQLTEMNYIKTQPWEHYIPITNKYFDDKQKYIKRINRAEWVRVNLMGKAIVQDNGKCTPGKYCTPYIGKIKALQGTAEAATSKSRPRFYVLERLSENTILIVNKQF